MAYDPLGYVNRPTPKGKPETNRAEREREKEREMETVTIPVGLTAFEIHELRDLLRHQRHPLFSKFEAIDREVSERLFAKYGF
jgi:hypothetical protein